MLQTPQKTRKLLPPLLEDPVQRLLTCLDKSAPRSLVALAGLPGAGKSTLAAQLGQEVNRLAGSGTMMVLGMDGFHLSKARLRQFSDPEEALRRRGAPWTFDVEQLASTLASVRQSANHESVWWPDFQHGVGDPVEGVHEIPASTRLVLVEGLYLLHRAHDWEEVWRQFDEHWYLDTPLDIAMERLTLRHMQSWKVSREEAVARIARNDQLNAELVLKSRSNSTWRVLDSCLTDHLAQ